MVGHLLRTILMSGRISAQREHHGEIVAKGKWPASSHRTPPPDSEPSRATLLDEPIASPGGTSWGAFSLNLHSRSLVRRPVTVSGSATGGSIRKPADFLGDP